MGALITIIPMLLQFLGPALEKVIPDAGKRAEVQAEFQKAVLENQSALNQAMAEVMKADAASEGWLTRNARPMVVVWGLAMVTYVGVIAPMLGLQKEVIAALSATPDNLWNLISISIGGFILARTVEKGIAAITPKAAR
ncbi:hypothetical protein ASF24_17085 [Methylobacterium sp. Leaf86]|uniref:3TM-type holin n=1 Tax=Methylobacterium sp. Leaf86 TaxID=1736242 RepID=UPI0006F4E717|nr:3TM-type holin [Methylobacterium sp. Leaf86]KQO57579.1 hypothetical protein ASF24_17085 [Methylobacterium sp. Leaf86]